jgi:hypothetical protein
MISIWFLDFEKGNSQLYNKHYRCKICGNIIEYNDECIITTESMCPHYHKGCYIEKYDTMINELIIKREEIIK